LPALVERAGNGSDGQGSITAFFTVLTEGDDLQDPIADAARAILDGHIVLARELADAGHYPAIDIEKSISRVMPMVTSPEHMELARTFKQFYSLYQQNRDLITIGAYSQGSDPRIDRAIIQKPYLDQFLQQKMREVIHYDEGLQSLQLVAMPLMR
jgi:flagellum-specific ATP synthase